MSHEDRGQVKAPTLSLLQLAWLQEIGLDKRMLARFEHRSATLSELSPEGTVAPSPTSASGSGRVPMPQAQGNVPHEPVVVPSKGPVRASGMAAPPPLHEAASGEAKMSIGLEVSAAE